MCIICAPVCLDQPHSGIARRFQLGDITRECRVPGVRLGKLLLVRPMLLFYLGCALSATHAAHHEQHREWTGQYDQDWHCGPDEVRRTDPDAEPHHR